MDLAHVLALLGGILVGLIAGLKIIAPMTKNTVDDTVLDYAEKAEAVLAQVAPAVPPAAK
jgi:hypothetical protein